MQFIQQVSPHLRAAVGAALLAAVSGTSAAAPKTIALPPDNTHFKQAPGSDIATARCMSCHSADYVQYQPPTTTRAAWEGEIKKMKNTFGATIPDDEIGPLADYLAKNYGSER